MKRRGPSKAVCPLGHYSEKKSFSFYRPGLLSCFLSDSGRVYTLHKCVTPPAENSIGRRKNIVKIQPRVETFLRPSSHKSGIDPHPQQEVTSRSQIFVFFDKNFIGNEQLVNTVRVCVCGGWKTIIFTWPKRHADQTTSTEFEFESGQS